MEQQEFLKISDVKKKLGVHRNTVINWIKGDKIKANRINGHYYIPVEEVDRLISEGKV